MNDYHGDPIGSPFFRIVFSLLKGGPEPSRHLIASAMFDLDTKRIATAITITIIQARGSRTTRTKDRTDQSLNLFPPSIRHLRLHVTNSSPRSKTLGHHQQYSILGRTRYP